MARTRLIALLVILGGCGMHAQPSGTQVASATEVPDAGSSPQPWDPRWRYGPFATDWWGEFTVEGGGVLTTSVSVEIVGSPTLWPLRWSTGRWANGVDNLTRGTLIVLHANAALGATAKTLPFRFLEDLAPTTDPDAATFQTNTTCQPLARGMVTITIDDSGPSQPTIAAPVLTKYSVKATFFHVPNFLNWVADARSLAEQGHETGAHTMTHRLLTELSASELDDELRLSKQWLEANLSSPVESFATPSGAYNEAVIAAIKTYFASHRTTNEGVNYVGSDVYLLRTLLLTNKLTSADVCAQLAEAAARRSWLILTFHDFTSAATASGGFTVTAQTFDEILACVTNTPGLDVVTQGQGVAAIRCGSP